MSELLGRLIWLAYVLRLRQFANALQRWAFERSAPRARLPGFTTPLQAVEYLHETWRWRDDRTAARFRFADWSSHPEVTEARRGSDEVGDCDDYHTWVAAALRSVPGVTDIVLMSCWSRKKGHTSCLFRQGGVLYHVDYRIRRVPSYEAALLAVRQRYRWTGPIVGWAFETPELDLIATYPEIPS